MKKLYTLGVTLTMVLFGTYSFAQIKTLENDALQHTKSLDYSVQQKANKQIVSPKDDPNVYFYEDFSNGLDGMGTNGAWTTGEAEGDLWVRIYPIDAPVDPYTHNQPIFNGEHPLYGDKIPNFFSETANVVNSPTMDNGVMMVDLDRYNAYEDNEVTATLISPTIDLSGITETDVQIRFFEKLRLCCATGSTVYLDLSLDNGANWIPYDALTPYGALNEVIDREIVINIADVIEGASDLSQIKVRFNFEGPQVAYYWFVDDLTIRKVPENDLAAKRTFYNNYIDYRNTFLSDEADDGDAADYYGAMEYIMEPAAAARTMNFAMEAENIGTATQTDVRLKVTGTHVDTEATFEWISETGISIEPGQMDTVRIGNVSLSDIGSLELGQYTFDFEVFQSEVEDIPYDNVGVSRDYYISEEIIRNDEGRVTNSKYPWGSDVIWGNKYVFTEIDVEQGEGLFITHVDAVFAESYQPDGTPWAVTIPGTEIFFNVRQNDPFFENDFVLFGTDNLEYEDDELSFVIDVDDIWEYGTTPTVWASFELPTPILVTPNVVYQAEYRVPFSQQDVLFPQLSAGINMEPYAFTAFVFEEQGWYSLGNSGTDRWNGVLLRFRTSVDELVGLEKVSVENGVSLVQNYPNPFTDRTRIQFNVKETTNAKFEVRDITGKLVYSKDYGTIPAYGVQTIEFERGSLASGVYTYSVVTPQGITSRKLTIE